MKSKITSIHGYHKYYKLPEKFEKVDRRKDKLYKTWREKKNKLLDLRIQYLKSELWWKSLNIKDQESMIKKYKSEDIAKKRLLRWTQPLGYKTYKTKNIEILEKQLKNIL